MSTPATIADVVRLLAVNNIRDAHRLALRAHGELKRTGATDDLLADLGQAAHYLGRTLAAHKETDKREKRKKRRAWRDANGIEAMGFLEYPPYPEDLA